MRIVASGDWHLDHVTQGVDRYEDVVAAARQIVKHATKHPKCDAFLFLGDLADPDDPIRALRAYWLAEEVAESFNANGIPSIWISGNHCPFTDGSGQTILHGLRHGAYVFEHPVLHLHFGMNVVALPFTAASHPYDPAAFVRDCVKRLDEGKRWNLPTVVMSHLMVPGAQPGEETKEIPRGREVVLPHEEIGKMLGRGDGRVFVTQGHYHRAQRIMLSGVEVLVAGAIAKLAFGEEENTPSFLDLEIG